MTIIKKLIKWLINPLTFLSSWFNKYLEKFVRDSRLFLGPIVKTAGKLNYNFSFDIALTENLYEFGVIL